MSGPQEAVEKSFPLNLPRTFEEIKVGFINPSQYLGKSISGMGSYFFLFDKYFPHVEALLLSCVGEGMRKAAVEIVATILITIFVLPFFCVLGGLYNAVAGGIKAGTGVVNYLEAKNRKHKAEDAAAGAAQDGDRFMKLFREAADHFCFMVLDVATLIPRIVYLIAGAYAFSHFDDHNVEKAFAKYEEKILNGEYFDQAMKWAEEHRWIKSSEGGGGGGGGGRSPTPDAAAV